MNTFQKAVSNQQYADSLASNWDNENYFHADTHINLIRVLCRDVGSELSRKVVQILDRQGYRDIVDLSCSPDDYDDPLLYLKDSQIIGLIKKYPTWDIGLDPRKEAMKTFIACEVQCKETNDKIYEGSLFRDPFVSSVIHRAQRKIVDILSDVPEIAELPFQFGPGSTFSVKQNTSVLSKLRSTLDVTPNCYGLASEMMESCPGWVHDSLNRDHGPQIHPRKGLNLIKGDRLAFVPKTAKTDRPICINGTLNAVIQKGIGSVIRDRLKPILDLRHAQSKHRRRARISSLNQEYCTIDLRSASDTICHALVMDLLPFRWFDLLDKARSPYYMIDNEWYPYHKFSAMGNGYTFELETLIFWALSDSVREQLEVKGDVLVYGDDIIAPTQCFDSIQRVLTHCGFQLNDEKSFKEGHFRESCGGDYFNGIEVRPFYLKAGISYRTLFLFHNFLARSGGNFLYPKTFRFIRKLIGKEMCAHFRGPDVEGDSHLVDISLPLSGFFYVHIRISGRRSRSLFNFGKAYGLYRLMFRQELRVLGKYIGSTSGEPPPEFPRKRQLKCKVKYRRYI